MAATIGGDTASVSNASVLLASARLGRNSITIQNLSATAMLTVSPKTAVSGEGYNLAPAVSVAIPGGSITLDGDSAAGAWYGIMSGVDATADNVAVIDI